MPDAAPPPPPLSPAILQSMLESRQALAVEGVAQRQAAAATADQMVAGEAQTDAPATAEAIAILSRPELLQAVADLRLLRFANANSIGARAVSLFIAQDEASLRNLGNQADHYAQAVARVEAQAAEDAARLAQSAEPDSPAA